MEVKVSLEKDKISLKFDTTPTQLIIYQLNYFGLNETINDQKFFEGILDSAKIISILSYLEKKNIKTILSSEINKYLEDLKNKEIEKKKKEQFLISLKQNPEKNNYNDFVLNIKNLNLKRKLETHQLKSLHHLNSCSSAAIFS